MRVRNILALLLSLTLSVSLLAGCAAGGNAETSGGAAASASPASAEEASESSAGMAGTTDETAPGAESREVTDMAGRTMTVPAVIDKVFSADSVSAIYLYTFDPDRLLGWNYPLNETEKKIILPEYQDLPSYGMGDSINYEAVIADGPQLALLVGNLGEGSIDEADQLSAKLGIPVFLISNDFLKTAAVYRALGELFDDAERAQALAGYVEETFAMAAEPIPEAEQVTVYFGNGIDSLETAPRGSSHAQIFEVVQAVNVAEVESESGSRVQISLEQLLAWDPDYIIVNGEPSEDLTGSRAAEAILAAPSFATVQAVEDGQVYGSPKAPFSWVDRPPGPNRIIGVRWLRALFYPDRCGYEVEDAVLEFYALFYHVELEDDQLAALFTD